MRTLGILTSIVNRTSSDTNSSNTDSSNTDPSNTDSSDTVNVADCMKSLSQVATFELDRKHQIIEKYNSILPPGRGEINSYL